MQPWLNPKDLALYHQILQSSDYIDKGPFRKALDILDGALRLYGEQEIALSFNGGKDATVMLHLVRAAVAGYREEQAHSRRKLVTSEPSIMTEGQPADQSMPIRCVYFVDGNGFSEMEEFVSEMESEHNLQLERFEGGYQEGCKYIMEKFGVKGFLLGTRKSDPHGQFVESFSPSSKGWPSFMRIHPILSWEFTDVWRFLVQFGLSYCKLYDNGYTSLGSRFDTQKNPALLRPDGTYRPAHSLILQEHQADIERNGRKSPSRPPSSSPTTPKMCEVGMITVGDEVLSAKVVDVNTQHACGELRRLGIVPKMAVILPDSLDDIARAVREMRGSFSAVITMGGIGPTHDDMTLKGVAEGLGVAMVHNVEMEHFLHSVTRKLATEDVLQGDFVCCTQKMCLMPQGTELLMEEGKDYPLLRCQNVYMLPGVPHFMRQQLAHVGRILKCDGRFVARKVGFSVDESFITEAIADIARSLPALSVGIYPFYEQREEHIARTVVVIEGHSDEEVQEGIAALLKSIPPRVVLFNEEGGNLTLRGEISVDSEGTAHMRS